MKKFDKMIIIFLFLNITQIVINKYVSKNVKENIFDLIEEEEMKFSKVEDSVNEYLSNPNQYISTHSNHENFIAIFSNFTKLNGEILYEEYVDNNIKKNLQNIIDNINEIKIKHLTKWEYDSSKRKFVLPDDSKIIF